MSSLIDLDELALRCRDEQARQYISEAVACYKAGACRSCIVATWNAIVFDFLHKLRELDLAGDKNARKKLDEFEAIRAGGENKLKDALEFERKVLEVAAKEFELLTPLEMKDLERIQTDRNRCAHPSMQSPEDPYQPTAELARTHLRHAVEIMLSREPVQGKAAFDRIINEIKSVYFPKDVEGAKQHFTVGPLKRARATLVRDLILGITRSNLNDDKVPWDERERQLSALAAILDMNQEIADDVIRKEINSIFSQVSDNRQWAVVQYLLQIPLSWDAANNAVKRKARTYLSCIYDKPASERVFTISKAMQIPDLRDIAVEVIGKISEEDIAMLITICPLREYIPLAIQYFSKSGNFRHAEKLGRTLILPLASITQLEDLRQILQAVLDNPQIWNAGDMPEIMNLFFDATIHLHGSSGDDWRRFISNLDSKRESSGLRTWYDELKTKIHSAGMIDELAERTDIQGQQT